MRGHWQDMGGYCTGSWPDGTPMLASHGPLQSVLSQLMTNGTITQSQATAVTSAFTQQIRAHWADGPSMRGYGPGMTGGSHMGWAN
jgi:hypothetical protein